MDEFVRGFVRCFGVWERWMYFLFGKLYSWVLRELFTFSLGKLGVFFSGVFAFVI